MSCEERIMKKSARFCVQCEAFDEVHLDEIFEVFTLNKLQLFMKSFWLQMLSNYCSKLLRFF